MSDKLSGRQAKRIFAETKTKILDIRHNSGILHGNLLAQTITAEQWKNYGNNCIVWPNKRGRWTSAQALATFPGTKENLRLGLSNNLTQ